jgi:hypothetical protein
MTDHSLREAMRKPHVKAFYLAELGDLRESERPRTFHRLVELRDQDDNKNAAVAASKVLEAIPDVLPGQAGGALQAGVVIRIVDIRTPPSPPTIDVTPAESTGPTHDAHGNPIFRPRST